MTRMRCREIEPDLLLHGLGELRFWRSWLISVHVARCARCRRTQESLLSASGRLAAALAPPGGAARMARPAVSVAQGWIAVACIAALIAGLLLVGGVRAARMRSHGTAAGQDIPCRPDLPNDQCR